ncbi:MAG: carbohydrate ABC transporter permease [Armatimonadota bacterium]|nr:carbohydrate ABC transporter permease [Armatimonadota bacterium]MDR5697789.1 carbohydrate ABC transporter permease [Armatimonadota bacterium]
MALALPAHVGLWILCTIWLVPTVGLLVSSFRPARDVATSGWWTVLWNPTFTLENYAQVLTTQNMALSFANSLVITIPATVIPLLIAAFAAYAFAWMEFPGRGALFIVVVALLVIPLQTTLVPVLRLFNALGLTGTFPALWLAHTGYGLPFAIYLLRNFIGSLPRDLFESAYLDGASPLTAFFRLVLPLSVPALASLAIFQFLWVWNDLLAALIYLGGRPAVAPMTVTISNLVNSLGGGWHLLTAAAFVSMALPLIVFFALQRYFVSGILTGAVKG